MRRIVDAVAGVIVFNWVFNNTKGSVLIIMLMHAANNAVSGSFFSSMFSGADQFAGNGYSLWSGQLQPSFESRTARSPRSREPPSDWEMLTQLGLLPDIG